MPENDDTDKTDPTIDWDADSPTDPKVEVKPEETLDLNELKDNSKPASSEHGGTSQPVNSSRRAFLSTLLGAGLAAGTVGSAAGHTAFTLARERHPEEENPSTEPNPKQEDEDTGMLEGVDEHDKVQEIMQEFCFSGEHTAANLEGMVATMKHVYGSQTGKATYYRLNGEIVLEKDLPPEYSKWQSRNSEEDKVAKQKWHNQNRKEAAPEEGVVLPGPNDPDERELTGYPLSAVPTKAPLSDIVNKRLDEEMSSDIYFNGEKVKLRDAITKIANAYGVPIPVAFGVGANESGFNREAVSEAGAKGIYQFLPSTADSKALPLFESHSGIRTEDLKGSFSENWTNRFVQIEAFCAHYKFLKEELEPKLEELKNRIKKLDPDFDVDLSPLAILTAYNGGKELTEGSIDRFIDLDDAELKKRLGPAPYGLDIWMAILAHNFGHSFKSGKKSLTVGPHVFHYPARCYAWASILNPDYDFFDGYREAKPEVSPDYSEEVQKAIETSRRAFWDAGWIATGALTLGGAAATAAITTGATGKEKIKENAGKGPAPTRRDILIRAASGVTAMAAAVSVPSVNIAKHTLDEVSAWLESTSEVPDDVETFEGYEEVARRTKHNLTIKYRDLRRADSHKTTDIEKAHRRKYTMPEQNELLDDTVTEWFSKDFIARFNASKKKRTKDRKALYEEGEKLQMAAFNAELASGEIIKMEADNPALPYFCEQVGKTSGTGNDADSLWMRKEFLPIMYLLVESVNHQIDLFNANPGEYGLSNMPIIPHISAIKISGAFRPLMYQYNLLSKKPSSTTKGLTMHSIARALDIASMATPDANMVRFAGNLDYKGETLIKSGGKLPTKKNLEGIGGELRDIISRMVGRALMAMEEPIKDEMGITVQPLWEQPAQNWHIVIKEEQTPLTNTEK